MQVELRKSKEEYQRLRDTLEGVLERQRAADVQVEGMQRALQKMAVPSNKNKRQA